MLSVRIGSALRDMPTPLDPSGMVHTTGPQSRVYNCSHNSTMANSGLVSCSLSSSNRQPKTTPSTSRSLGVESHTLAWISSYLFNCNHKFVVAGTTSSPCYVLSGVPQGSVLGPLLFLVYTDGLTDLQLTKGWEPNYVC